jgi:hypothetical protein
MRDDGKGRARRPLIQEVWVAQMRGAPQGITEIPTCSQCQVLTSPRYLGLRSICRVWSRSKSHVAENDLQGTLELLCMR